MLSCQNQSLASEFTQRVIIQEVIFQHGDGSTSTITNPRVDANVPASTYVVKGKPVKIAEPKAPSLAIISTLIPSVVEQG